MEKVNHPEHYQSIKGIECIDVMEAFTEGLEGIEAVDTAQVIKYVCRWKKKNGLEDLEKAEFYLHHLMEYLIKKDEDRTAHSYEKNNQRNFNVIEFTCPTCGKVTHTNFERNYCGECGQRLDWSEEDE